MNARGVAKPKTRLQNDGLTVIDCHLSYSTGHDQSIKIKMSAQQSGFGPKVWERGTYKPKSSDKGAYDQEPHKNISML
jgi:hypothetical protein